MEIVRLPLGEQAPVDADCIRIEEQPGATYTLTASALWSALTTVGRCRLLVVRHSGLLKRPRQASPGRRTSASSACL